MTSLARILHDQLAVAPLGRLPFAAIMDLALYHPEHGYYGPGPRRLGRSGDFFTAVSVGPLYGRLLARLAAQTAERLGLPVGELTVVEQAAHDGQLAEDILNQSPCAYTIVEPNPRYQEAQQARLAGFGSRVRWVPALHDLPAVPALFVCNELPDAMPVHRVQWDGRTWQELYVRASGDAFAFVPGPPSSASLEAELLRLPHDLPSGHITEIGLAALDWMRDLAAARFHGAVYVADYGHDHDELHALERPTGTLRRYRGHQMDDRVLEDLGECDLTCHIDFTRLIETAEAAGLSLTHYGHQGRFLGQLGLEWLRTLDGRPPDAETQALLRQYQSLTHPAFLGRSFRVLLLDKPRSAPTRLA